MFSLSLRTQVLPRGLCCHGLQHTVGSSKMFIQVAFVCDFVSGLLSPLIFVCFFGHWVHNNNPKDFVSAGIAMLLLFFFRGLWSWRGHFYTHVDT